MRQKRPRWATGAVCCLCVGCSCGRRKQGSRNRSKALARGSGRLRGRVRSRCPESTRLLGAGNKHSESRIHLATMAESVGRSNTQPSMPADMDCGRILERRNAHGFPVYCPFATSLSFMASSCGSGSGANSSPRASVSIFKRASSWSSASVAVLAIFFSMSAVFACGGLLPISGNGEQVFQPLQVGEMRREVFEAA